MKKIFTIASALFLTVNLWAQAPEKMSYQAVIRDASNSLTTNQAVGMQISILQTDANGTAVYVETHSPTTNANGLVSLEIGTGAIIIGDFSAIDWSAGPYFIKTETDPTGGTNYTITGTSQLLSVPYALHAKTADSITGTVNYTETDPIFGASVANGITIADTANWNNHTVDTDTNIDSIGIAGLGYVAGVHTDSTAIANMGFVADTGGVHYVGELFGGGIVYYVYDNGSHGLIASLDDLDGGSGVAWSPIISDAVPINARSMTDGAANTLAIVSQDATPGYAATLCNSYMGGGFSDWYLPSNRELTLLARQDILINQILDNDGNGASQPLDSEFVAPTFGRYWSSTEFGNNGSWLFQFSFDYSKNDGKFNTLRVRAVRAF